MTNEQIAEFVKWLKENEPYINVEAQMKKPDAEMAYWELFAYRIVTKLGV